MTYRKNVIPARIIITKNQQYITYFLIFFYFFTYTTLFPDLKTPRNTPQWSLCAELEESFTFGSHARVPLTRPHARYALHSTYYNNYRIHER
jgi:hypothetical protein